MLRMDIRYDASMLTRFSICLLCLLGLFVVSSKALAADRVFPGATWQTKSPSDLGLDDKQLDVVAMTLGGQGCVVRHGYVIKSWGDQSKRWDIYSASKPVLSTLLMFALQEGKIKSFDQPIADYGWTLSQKDRTMTFRHLANMTSAYGRQDPPGEAWAYNDYAIELYQKTLFDKVFRGDPAEVFHDPNRFGALQLEDRFTFRDANRRMSASVRDFARVNWLWLNHGNWNGKQILPKAYFEENMRPQVPADLPRSINAPTNDYLMIGTYGGESSRKTQSGPGIYGFNWWFNAPMRHLDNRLTWPDAPLDTVMALGFRGNCSLVVPSLDLVVVGLEADWGGIDSRNQQATMNDRLKLIIEASTTVEERTKSNR